MEKLLDAGALDVFFTPIYMKKSRPAVKLSFIAKESNLDALEKILFTETSTIGIRKTNIQRTTMDRKYENIDTKYGKIQVKRVSYKGIGKCYGEYEDIKKAAIKYNVPIQTVYDEIKHKTEAL